MITFDFTGRHVFVNGGTGGIGSAIVRSCFRSGADVSFVWHGNDGARAEAEELLREGTEAGCAMAGRAVDTSDPQGAQSAVAACVDLRGRLDALVNVAGITRDAMLWKLTPDDWSRVMAVNAGSFFYCIRAAAPHFRAAKGGRIVNITSINGMRGKAGQANYAASKAAVIALTKTAARELGPSQVTVNAVAPGFIETKMTAALPEAVVRRALEETALGRAGAPEDVAAAVLFLLSDSARHITGEVLRVDGGQYM